MNAEATLALIRSELDRPVSDAEANYYGCQCLADYAAPLLDRVMRILSGEDPTKYEL